MATREQVAELEAAESNLDRCKHGLNCAATRQQAMKWQLAIVYAQGRLINARAACIGEQEMPGGK